MKNSRKLFISLLSVLLFVGCTNNTTSSNKSSTNDISSSEHSSVSLQDNINILKGDLNTSITNPLNWVYNDNENIIVEKAKLENDKLTFIYSLQNEATYQDAALYFHNTEFIYDSKVEIKFTIKSSVAGIILVNGVEQVLREGTTNISFTAPIIENSPTLTIYLGNENNSSLSNNVSIDISNLQLNKIKNAADYIKKAIANDNYTLYFESDVAKGTYKYLKNATYFNYYEPSGTAVIDERYGFAENDTGLFVYTYNSIIYPNNSYLKDTNDEIIKGIYTTKQKLQYTSFGDTYKGVPSLRKLDLTKLNYEITDGSLTKVTSISQFSDFTSIFGAYNFVFKERKTTVHVGINANDELYFEVNDPTYGTSFSITVKDVDNTSFNPITRYLAKEDNGPGVIYNEIDPNFKDIYDLICSNNLTLTYGENKIIYNDKYSFLSFANSGYIKTVDGIYDYSIDPETNVISLGTLQNANNISDLINLKHQSPFNVGAGYYFNEETNKFEADVMDTYEFSINWLNEPHNFNRVEITYENDIINITLHDQDKSCNVVLSNFNSSTYQALENYLDK